MRRFSNRGSTSGEKVRAHQLLFYWLKYNLSRNHFLLLSGVLVGCSAGLAGVLLKVLVHNIHNVVTRKVLFEEQIFYYACLPFVGLVITSLIVIFIFKGQDRKGIPAILYEIAKNSSFVSPVKMYSQIIQSAITVGFGGSAGLESPIAVTGAAIGSNFAQRYKLSYKDRTLLLAAGATAGIAAAFNAPIAGMMFAFEILLTGVVFTDFIPLVVSAVCGSLLSKVILNEDTLFQFGRRHSFDYHNIVFYLALGLVCGLYARYFVLISQRVERYFKKVELSRLQKAVTGGILLSTLCLLFPPLFGEGYQSIKDMINGKIGLIIEHSFFRFLDLGNWLVIIFLFLICIFKAFAASITIHSGGNGGNFAPSLFAGGVVGYLFATICIQLGIANVPVTNLIIVGMAGVMSGVLYAPLTAVFLIAESSSGYDLFLPLMMVCVISFLIAKWFSPISPDLKHLADSGKIFTHQYDKNLLLLINISSLVEKDVSKISIGSSINDLIEVIKSGKRNLIAVLDEDSHLAGTIAVDELRPILFDEKKRSEIGLAELVKFTPVVVYENEDMTGVADKFDQSGSWVLPVLDSTDRFVGFVSKSTFLNTYREILKEHSEI
ncbi:chloride channel protein [Desertivirga brevis]|uniref:chloride channel protein n=1 Tax=Desertivirga brevis TaxID=2810310 RepID=UPI001A97CE28